MVDTSGPSGASELESTGQGQTSTCYNDGGVGSAGSVALQLEEGRR